MFSYGSEYRFRFRRFGSCRTLFFACGENICESKLPCAASRTCHIAKCVFLLIFTPARVEPQQRNTYLMLSLEDAGNVQRL